MKRWLAAGAALLGLTACGSVAPPVSAGASPGPPRDGVFEVLQAGGRAYVVQGPAPTPPARGGSPVLLGRGRSVEVVDEGPLHPALSFTLVGVRGSCTSTASSMTKLGTTRGWLDAMVLDGCRGDPMEERLALVGEVPDARWLAPTETLTADGEPLPSSEFFQGNVSGKSLQRTRAFPGLSLVFEQGWVEPNFESVATRVVEGNRVISAFFGDVEGAVRSANRWLIIVRQDSERSILELVGDDLVPRLGSPPAPAPIERTLATPPDSK